MSLWGRFALFLWGILVFPTCVRGQAPAPFHGLRAPVDAYVTALGGYHVSFLPAQAAALQNPATLLPAHGGFLSVAYTSYQAGIHMGQVLGSFSLQEGRYMLGLGGRHLSYGRFEGYDARGVFTHRFTAQDNMFWTGGSFVLPPLSFGFSAKSLFSQLDDRLAYGIFSDVGALLKIKEDFSLGVSVKDLPFFARDYQNRRLPTPTPDVWIGCSLRPERMPLRLSFTGYRLLRALPYYHEAEAPVRAHREQHALLDEVLGRAHLSAEAFLLRDNLRFLFGLNLARRRNLVLNERTGLSGLSFGVFFSVRYFQIILSRSYHVSTGHTHLSVAVDCGHLYKRKRSLNSK